MKRIVLISISFLFVLGTAWAQRTVSGMVTSDDGNGGIPGVNVILKGTATGTTTDLDGNYRLSVPEEGGTLEYSFIGLVSQEVVIGARAVIDITMTEDVETLSEVVVTALGVERDKKALGYSVQQVDSKLIEDAATTNVIDALQGKVAGVQITRSSGAAGSASNITIRGATSLVGNNQPLIVVDGIRINNDAIYTEGTTAGTSQASGIMAINPDDIATLSVLKGGAATSLYGTEGSRGVILITTKKGTKGGGLKVNFSSSVAFDKVSTMPELQNIYAQGAGGEYGDPSTGSSTSWGPLVSALEYATNADNAGAPGAGAFNADGDYIYDNNGFLVPLGTGNGQAANVYDNVDDFYQMGVSLTNALSLEGSSDKASFRFSMSNFGQEGIIPNNTYNRNSFQLGSTYKANENFSMGATMNYTQQKFNRIQQGSNTSGVNLGLYRTPSTFDNSNGFGADGVGESSSYIFANGSQRNYRGGGGYDNPFWIVNLAPREETNNRFFGSFNAAYTFNDWIKVSVNAGTDYTSDFRKQIFEIGSRTAAGGRITHDDISVTQSDFYARINGSGSIAPDFVLSYFVGANMFDYNLDRTFLEGNTLSFQGYTNIANAGTVAATGFAVDKYRTLGVFGSAELAWRNTIYFVLTGRQDYDTRLAVPGKEFSAGDIGFFYPSTSLSFIFSELIDIPSVSFGKLRASWSQVGAGPPYSYSTSTVYNAQSPDDGWGDPINFPLRGVNGFELSGTLGNADLKPETTTAFEIGADIRFLEGRIGLDVSYFNRKGEDLILDASLARSTGYSNVYMNAGQMTTEGTEIILDINAVNKPDFNWNVTFNWSKVISTVDALAPGIDQLQIAGFTGTGIFLVAGNTYGSIFGGAYKREAAGTAADDGLNIPAGPLLINDDPTSLEYGFQQADETLRAIGDATPDWILGIKNSIDYKRFNLAFLFDWRKGGDIWNGTNWALSYFGRSQLTADTRVETPFAIPGVKSDGTANDIEIVRDQSYWTSSVGGFGSVDEQFVEDGGWVRLRELSLTYALNPQLFGDGFIKGLSLGFYGHNLWYSSDFNGVDPETSLTGVGNGQGLDYFNQPGTRSYAFKLNANF